MAAAVETSAAMEEEEDMNLFVEMVSPLPLSSATMAKTQVHVSYTCIALRQSAKVERSCPRLVKMKNDGCTIERTHHLRVAFDAMKEQD